MANEQTTMTKSETQDLRPAESTRSGYCFRPNVDILERADELIVQADVPGARGEEIDIDFEDGLLTIHARVAERQPADTQYLRREYGVGDFYRTFRISEAVDASQISAECADGVLTLHLPKSEAARPRKIAVKAD